MKIASMHAPIKIGTSIDAINLYERHSLSEYVYILLIEVYMILVVFILSVKKLIWLYIFNGYFGLIYLIF